jgi:hypothetical protein
MGDHSYVMNEHAFFFASRNEENGVGSFSDALSEIMRVWPCHSDGR